jgi:hypothetical protein
MSPAPKAPVPGPTSQLRRVRLDPSHYRSGRWFVVAEGVVVSAAVNLALLMWLIPDLVEGRAWIRHRGYRPQEPPHREAPR